MPWVGRHLGSAREGVDVKFASFFLFISLFFFCFLSLSLCIFFSIVRFLFLFVSLFSCFLSLFHSLFLFFSIACFLFLFISSFSCFLSLFHSFFIFLFYLPFPFLIYFFIFFLSLTGFLFLSSVFITVCYCLWFVRSRDHCNGGKYFGNELKILEYVELNNEKKGKYCFAISLSPCYIACLAQEV